MSYKPFLIQNPICNLQIYHLNINLIIWSLMKYCQDKWSSTYIEPIICYLLYWCAFIKAPGRLLLNGEVKSNRSDSHYLNINVRPFLLSKVSLNSELLFICFLMLAKIVSILKKKLLTMKVILCFQMKYYSLAKEKLLLLYLK